MKLFNRITVGIVSFGLGFVIWSFGYSLGYHFGLTAPSSVTARTFEKEAEAEATIRQRIELLLTVQSIIMCESGGHHDGLWGDSQHRYPAYGIGQFQERTFYWLAKQSGMKGLRWKKVEDQLRLLLWAVDNGYAGLWTCYRRV